MLRILAGIETNPHWEPLNDFDKIAAGIFRWQKAEQRSGGAREILDGPSVVATERVNMDVYRLTRTHVLELGFFEVCRYPDVVNGNDGKQTLSWLNPLAEFDGFPSNDTTDRSVDFGIAQVEFSRANIRLGLAHLADARFRLGLGVVYLLRGGMCRLHLSQSLLDQTAQLSDFVLFGNNRGAIGFKRLGICERLRLVSVIFQTRDHSSVNQTLISHTVPFGASIYSLVLFHSVLCCRQIGLFGINCGNSLNSRRFRKTKLAEGA